jgi:hypothetical protein
MAVVLTSYLGGSHQWLINEPTTMLSAWQPFLKWVYFILLDYNQWCHLKQKRRALIPKFIIQRVLHLKCSYHTEKWGERWIALIHSTSLCGMYPLSPSIELSAISPRNAVRRWGFHLHSSSQYICVCVYI